MEKKRHYWSLQRIIILLKTSDEVKNIMDSGILRCIARMEKISRKMEKKNNSILKNRDLFEGEKC